MAQDTSFLALYVLCNAISPVRMTIWSLPFGRGSRVEGTTSRVEGNESRVEGN